MRKIWVKVYKDEKIVKGTVIEYDLKRSNFFDGVMQVCSTVDIPTPLVLKNNINNFFNFKNTRFYQKDFVETVNFDVLLLEDISD